MLNKLVQKKKTVLIGCVVVSLIFWILTLFFCNEDGKINLLVLSLVLPFVIYGSTRLIFKAVKIKARSRFIKFTVCFFLLFGVLGVFVNALYFFIEFPNGLSPTLTACLGLVIAVLDEAKKT